LIAAIYHHGDARGTARSQTSLRPRQAAKGARPTFHEIRALGAWLYEQQNFPQEYIQALMGHADEKMTKHYQEGHDEKKIEYLEVGAELVF
jgi:integrase